jgi:hypothetical protein
MEPTSKPATPRLRQLLQPAIIRIYKGAGIFALGALLIGLVLFLTVNIFYYFNTSWVRPMILSPSHEKVAAAVSAMADADLQRSTLDGQKMDADAEAKQVDRMIAADDKFLADAGTIADGPIKTADQALIRRQLDQATLERAGAVDRKAALDRRLQDLDTRITEQDALIAQLEKSPYLKAAKGRVVVAFVPYENLETVHAGDPLYGCNWGLVNCSEVGKVVSILDGEVNDINPHDNSPRRGVLAEITLTDAKAAQDGILFAGRKPFWIF